MAILHCSMKTFSYKSEIICYRFILSSLFRLLNDIFVFSNSSFDIFFFYIFKILSNLCLFGVSAAYFFLNFVNWGCSDGSVCMVDSIGVSSGLEPMNPATYPIFLILYLGFLYRPVFTMSLLRFYITGLKFFKSGNLFSFLIKVIFEVFSLLKI